MSFSIFHVLGIETSCDDTAVAVVRSDGVIVSEHVASQDHSLYGGVVPNVAAGLHLQSLCPAISSVMEDSGLSFEDLRAVAVTAGPGLLGSLLVGVMAARGFASASKLDLIPINHLEAHALVVRLEQRVEFPFLLLIISGGHCQFVLANEFRKYTVIGRSLDDAPGEVFDKIARELSLGYPGGPAIEELAKFGNDRAFDFPRPMLNAVGCNLSFSGIKTAVKSTIDKLETFSDSVISDICASMQRCVSDVLCAKILGALSIVGVSNVTSVVVTGGVAANIKIRAALTAALDEEKIKVYFPSVRLSTDNGVMVAWAGVESILHGCDSFGEFHTKSEWSLEDL